MILVWWTAHHDGGGLPIYNDFLHRNRTLRHRGDMNMDAFLKTKNLIFKYSNSKYQILYPDIFVWCDTQLKGNCSFYINTKSNLVGIFEFKEDKIAYILRWG